MGFLFENLDVYNLSMELADEVTNLAESFPRGKFHIKDQLCRAITSIPYNIAEGNGKFTSTEKKSFFRISRGSAFECVSILSLCRKKDLISEEQNKKYRGNFG